MAFNPGLILETPRFQPHPYQDRAVRSTIAGFKAGYKSQLVIHPTGTGKTFVAGWVARWAIKHGRRALVLAHTKDLIEQMANSMVDLGVPVAIEMGEQYARADGSAVPLLTGMDPGDTGPVCVIASRDTMVGSRLASWDHDYFGLVVVDEAHHIVSPRYQKIIRHFGDAFLFGLTATPDRMDGEDLGQIFQRIADQYSLSQAIEEGWLCRPRFVELDTGIDLRELRPGKNGDYSDSALAEILTPHIEFLANAIRQEIGNRLTIVFMPDITTSQFMASALSGVGVASEAVWGERSDRSSIVSAFRAREFQALCNAMVLTEGVDVPEVSAVAFCRPTKSRALKSQMAGRGLRVRKPEPDALMIDFGFLTLQKDTLVDCFELFDSPSYSDDVLEEARKSVKSGETDDLFEAVKRAEKKSQERAVLRIHAHERKVRYGKVVYDFQSVMDAVGIPYRKERDDVQRPNATAGQVSFLHKMGVQNPESMSRQRATRMIEYLKTRMNEGKATHKQLGHLIAQGIDPKVAREMSKEEASAKLTELWGRN